MYRAYYQIKLVVFLVEQSYRQYKICKIYTSDFIDVRGPLDESPLMRYLNLTETLFAMDPAAMGETVTDGTR